MHRSKESRLVLGSTLAAALSFAGLASAETTTKADANQPKKADHVVVMKAEPTEVAIQGNADQIKELQRQLASRGFYQGSIDGVAGAKTRAALRNFQVQQGLPVEGGLNAQTRDSLGIDWDRQPVSGTDEPQPVQRGQVVQRTEKTTTSDTIQVQKGTEPASQVRLSTLNGEHAKEVQQRLHDMGYYNGPIDGQFGAGTRAALQRYFQRQAQLAQQGLIDPSAIGAFGIESSDVRPVAGEEAKPQKSMQ